MGGLANAATHLAETLARDHEVHYFTRGDRDQEIKGVHYHCCRPSGGNIVDYCRSMSQMMLEQFRQADRPMFDILHFHDWHAVEALHQLRERGTIFSYHSTEYGRNGGSFGDWWEFREISGKEWYGGLIARQVVVVSHTLKNEVKWLYQVPDEKITVIPNGVVPAEFRADLDPGSVKAGYGIHPYAPLVLFCGRMVYQKGPDILADAIPLVLKNHSDARFIFIGEGHMRRWLTERTSGLPVQFLGWLPDSEYVRLLNASNIVVIPSRNEPFGLVLLEAWSAERCVVATEVGGLSENIDNFKDGVKVYTNPGSVAWGINYCLEERDRMRILGREGRRKVERYFRWESIAKRVTDLYRGVSG